jgi:ABC-type transporter Mla MlaB component
MFRRQADNFDLKLSNAEGIPVLHVVGTMGKSALKAIAATFEQLAGAGHLHIVLNLERVQTSDWRMLGGLAAVVRKIQKHHGTVDLVATPERHQQLVKLSRVARLFRLCASTGEAISRIKGLSRRPEVVVGADARFVERP